MEKCLKKVISMSVFTVLIDASVSATERQEVYSLRTSENHHQYLMLTVKSTVGGQDESVDFFPLFSKLLWQTKT